MELGKLIKVNFQGDCFYRAREIKSSYDSFLELGQKLRKSDETFFGDALRTGASFRNAYAYNLHDWISEKALAVAHILVIYFGYCMRASNKQLKLTGTKIKKMTKEEYEGMLKKADEASSIGFCKIKVTGSPDFDYVFCFIKDEGDFPKTIAEYFKKLQEKHPRKYKNLKYRIQFTGKF